jgi:hypothetical protein
MGNATTFEALALELSPTERSELLDRLQSGFTVSTEPLYEHSATAERHIDYKAVYRELGIITRLIITVRSLLGQGSKDELVKERIIHGIFKRIETLAPGLIEARRRVLNEAFYRELSSLRGAARYFYDILDRTLEKNRASFFAFFASLELDEVHNELSIETDPYIYAERNSLATDSDVRIGITQAMETAISRIGEDQRRNLYRDVKNLHVLKKLSGFLFDRFLGAFQTNQSGFKEISMYAAIDQLAELASILSSLDQPPSKKLMESIIGFALNDEIGREGFNLEDAVGRELASAEKALAVIRDFNARVPLEDILKVANDDPNWQCASTGGGEDWFTIFKAYWKDRVEKRFQRFSAERRIAMLESEIQALVGKDTPTWFINLSETGNDSIPPVRFARALRFLEAFYHQAFLGDINKSLKTILLDGEFYKRDNRMDFTDAYNEILQTGDALKKFDARLGANGELGYAYVQAKGEMSSTQIKRRKVESAIKAVETEAESILAHTGDAMGRLTEILKAILSREARGRYDSLSNLSSIEGRANKDFQRNLEASKDKLEKSKYLLGELTRSAVSALELG